MPALSLIQDPFAKVRSLGGTLLVLLSIRAALPGVHYIVSRFLLPSGEIDGAQFQTLRLVNVSLLGLANLIAFIAFITFLVWIHATTVAIRRTGGTTTLSPGMAVGGWFIPVANVVLPCLSVRSALRGVQQPGILAVVWWIVYLIDLPLLAVHQLAVQLWAIPELMRAIPPEILEDVLRLSHETFWPYLVADTLAWGLLALVVASVMKGSRRTET
jgi:hypothetical protein